MTQEYKIAKDTDHEKLGNTISDLLQNNWHLHGTLSVTHFFGNNVVYAQALVRDTEQRGPWS